MQQATNNIVQLRQVGLAPAGARERYCRFPSIAQAALIWSDLAFEVLEQYESDELGAPIIPSQPEIAWRAMAISDAIDHGELACERTYAIVPGEIFGDPVDFRKEQPGSRRIKRVDLLAWLEAHFPDEAPGRVPVPVTPAAVPAQEDRLLREPDVLDKVGISHATLWRRIKAGTLPAPTHDKPNRWPESIIQAHIRAPAEDI